MNKRYLPRLIISLLIFVTAIVSVVPSLFSGSPGSQLVTASTAFLSLIASVASIVAILTIRDTLYKTKDFLEPQLHREIMTNPQNDRLLSYANETGHLSIPFAADERLKPRIERRLANRQGTDRTASILDAFELAGRQLIILSGTNASGAESDASANDSAATNTYILRQLYQQLHQARSKDEREPIPFIFDLDFWQESGLTLTDWFVHELEQSFTDTELSRATLERLRALTRSDRLVFLLDGFDNLSLNQVRQAELKKFLSKEPRRLFVLCANPKHLRETLGIEDYSSYLAVTLQPLGMEEIIKYLAEERYQDIRELVLAEDKLLEVAHRPPMLIAIGDTYDFAGPNETTKLKNGLDSGGDAVSLIMDDYIQLLFRRVSETRFGTETINAYLINIAHKLSSEIKSIQVETIRPAWLPNDKWRLIYVFCSRALGCAAIAASVGILLSHPFDFVFFGLVGGIAVSAADLLLRGSELDLKSDRFSVKKLLDAVHQRVGDQSYRWIYHALHLILVYLFCSLLLSLVIGAMIPSTPQDHILGGPIALTGVTVALFLSLFIATIYTMRDIRIELPDDIKPFDTVKLEVGKPLLYGAVGALLVGLIVATVAYFVSLDPGGTQSIWLSQISNASGNPWVNPITIGLALGVFFGGIVVTIFGFVKVSNEESRLRPNQGISNSIQRALVIFLVVAILIGVGSGVGLWLYYRDFDGLTRGIRNGLAIGLLAGLWYGGLDAMHHGVRRVLLDVSKSLPLELSDFVSYCTKSYIFRQNGANYSFNSTAVQSYYAEKDVPDSIQPKILVPYLLAFGAVLLLLSLTANGLYPLIRQAHDQYREGDSWAVSGPLTTTTYIHAGQQVQVKSMGEIYAGPFVGYITPEGTRVGALGLPGVQAYNFPYLPNLPDNALVCKLTTEPDENWRACAQRQSLAPFSTDERMLTFSASRDGYLRFDINAREIEKRRGAFYVQIILNPH